MQASHPYDLRDQRDEGEDSVHPAERSGSGDGGRQTCVQLVVVARHHVPAHGAGVANRARRHRAGSHREYTADEQLILAHQQLLARPISIE